MPNLSEGPFSCGRDEENRDSNGQCHNATGMPNQNRRSTRHNDAADVVSESSDDSSMPILEDPAGADDGSSSSSESSSEDLFDNSSDDSREGFFPVVTFRVNTESNRSDDESSMPPLDIDEAIADRETNDELDGPPVNVESDSSDYDSSDISSMPLLEDIDNGAIAMNDVEAMTTTETNDEMNGPLESITVQLPIDEDGDDESMPGMDDKVYIITQSGIILPKDENDDVESIESIDSSYDSGDDSDVSNFSFHTQPPEESGSISSASDPEQEESGIRNPSNSADHQSTSPLTHLCDFGVMCVFATGICPVCLEECTPVIALPCGHVLCEEDYKRMGGYRSSA